MHQSIQFLDPTFVPLQADPTLDEQVVPDLHLPQLFLFLELVIHNQLNKSKTSFSLDESFSAIIISEVWLVLGCSQPAFTCSKYQ